jgi:hypothetical protein
MAAQGPGAVEPNLVYGGLGAEQDRKPNRQGESPQPLQGQTVPC